MYFIVGLSSGEYSLLNLKCQDGDCISDLECYRECYGEGFKYGGACYKINPKTMHCCCRK